MNTKTRLLAVLLAGLVVFSASAFAWVLRGTTISGYDFHHGYGAPSIGPGTNPGNLPPVAQKSVSLIVKVNGRGNPRNIVGTLYAQVGFGRGETRGYVSTTNGTLVFSNLRPNQYYFLKLQTIGGTALYPFTYVGKNDTTVTKFV